MEAEEAVAALTAIRGVGRWTAEVYLLFALGHPDIFPAGDLALQESARLAFDLDARPKEKEILSRAENWRPHRAAAARLLWAYYRVAKARDATPI
jgi:DNA-3-methyladenine glycosylase II